MPLKLKPIPAIIFAVFSINSSNIIAAEVLPDVEVKGTIVESPERMEIELELDQVPGGTNIIDLDKRTGSQATLSDVLGFEAGIIIQEFFGGNDQPRLNIRGSGIQDNPVSRGVQLLYDGLPLNQADGTFIIGLLDPEQAMLISVYRGSNAMQYGASTLGGAINFIQRNDENSNSTLRLEAGSFNSFNGSINLAGKVKQWDYLVMAGHDRGDGFRNNNKGERTNLMMNAGYHFGDNNENRTYVHITDNFFEIPFVLPKDRAIEFPSSVLGDMNEPIDILLNVNERKPLRDIQQFRLANKTTLRNHKRDLTLGLYGEIIDDAFKNMLTNTVTQATTVGLEYSYKLYSEGISSKYTDNYLLFVSSSYSDMPRDFFIIDRQTGMPAQQYFDSLGLEAGNLAMGIQAANSLSESLQLVTSLQWVLNDRFISDKKTPGLLDSEFSYRSLNPKLGLIYHADDDTRYFTNISRSSEAPSFWQLVLISALPVTDRQSARIVPLELQEAVTFEVGTEGQRADISWKLNYYYSLIENELISEVDDDFGINGRTVNYSDDTVHQGVELDFNSVLADELLQSLDQLQARVVYNFAHYRFKGGRFDGNQIAGIPEHLLQAQLSYQMINGVSIAPNVKWMPKKTAVDHINGSFQETYTLWGLKLAWQYSDKLRFFADFDNLGDEVYQTSYVIHGSSVDDNGNLVPTFIPGAPFNFSVGMVMQW